MLRYWHSGTSFKDYQATIRNKCGYMYAVDGYSPHHTHFLTTKKNENNFGSEITRLPPHHHHHYLQHGLPHTAWLPLVGTERTEHSSASYPRMRSKVNSILDRTTESKDIITGDIKLHWGVFLCFTSHVDWYEGCVATWTIYCHLEAAFICIIPLV